MPNTNVYRGSDAALMFAPTADESLEREAGNEVIEAYELNPVGRVREVEVYVETDLEEFHEIGRRHATQLRPGNIHVHGMIHRAFINGALLKLLLGQGTEAERQPEPFPQPAFNLVLFMEDPANPGTNNSMVIHGVKLENWSFNLPEDDFVIEKTRFRGLRISVADAEA